MRTSRGASLAALLLLVIVFPAFARQNLITNGGFESPGFDGEDYRYLTGSNSALLTGWTCVWDGTQEATYVYFLTRYETLAGDYTAYLNDGDTLTTTVAVQDGVTYRVSFEGYKNTAVNSIVVECAGSSITFATEDGFPTGERASRGSPVYRYQRSMVAHATGTVPFVIRNPQDHNECFSCGGMTIDSIRLEPACCAADFDCDGFVTGADFDQFVQAFEAGDASADFDGDGFITGLDFDLFVQAFEAGC